MPKQTNWISVKERRPRKGKLVTLFKWTYPSEGEAFIDVGYYTGEIGQSADGEKYYVFKYFDQWGDSIYTRTEYWTPLPPKPKKR